MSKNSKSTKPKPYQQPKTKLVIRKLPECTTEEDIKKLLEPYNTQYDYFYFEKPSKLYKINTTKSLKKFYSRFYINFKDFSNVITFVSNFKNIQFPISKKKNKNENNIETVTAIVEYAPYQKIPLKQKKLRDKRIDTIYKDEDYIKFIENIENENNKKIEYLDKILPKILDSHTGALPKYLIDEEKNDKIAPLAKYIVDNKYRSKRPDRRLYMTRRQLERERIRERERIKEEKRLKREQRKYGGQTSNKWEIKKSVKKSKIDDISQNINNNDKYYEKKRYKTKEYYDDKSKNNDYYSKHKSYKDDYYNDKSTKYKDDKYYNNNEYYDDQHNNINDDELYENNKYYNKKGYNNNYYDDYSYSNSRNYYRENKKPRGRGGGRSYKQKSGYGWNRK